MVDIRVCVGTSCHLNGSYNVVQEIQQLIEEHSLHEEIEFEAVFCAKQCQATGVSIKVNDDSYRVEPTQVNEFFHEKIMSRISH